MLTLRSLMEERVFRALIPDRRIKDLAVRLYVHLLQNPLNTISGHAADMGITREAVRCATNRLVEHGWAYRHRERGRRGALIIPCMPPEVELQVVAGLAQVRTEIHFYGEWLMKNVLDVTVKDRDYHDNARPQWLTTSTGNRLELDRWYRQANVAFEFQGEQHSRVDGRFVKTPEQLEQRQLYDQKKRDLCARHGIELIELTAIDLSVEQIRETVRGKLELSPVREDTPLFRELTGMCRNYVSHAEKKAQRSPPDEN